MSKLSGILRVLQNHRNMINSPSGINVLIRSGNQKHTQGWSTQFTQDITKYFKNKYLMKSGEP